ncbi:hypothetical protein [Burkholderia sp. Ac-20392]|uniref:hypothetical protein n=1 Tax=Burkholderia sp. Ac-20392 TaxID=2703905 RepID=UPI00197DB0F6|nr:hypothetical protein [Burkholderia sp. Ac-20392]MBN3794381.1 hypothetical protein [Burkholderia sp. Ac-20392]
MSDLNGALIGFLGVMAGGYFNNFLAEDYRRFRDGQALAGALAGELESHGDAFPMLKAGLEAMMPLAISEQGLTLSEWPIPASPLFEQNAAKIGLLGADVARDVAYVYEHIRAFRINFHMLSKSHREMPKERNHAMIVGCLAIITRAETRGRPLLDTLKKQATGNYWQRLAGNMKKIAGTPPA